MCGRVPERRDRAAPRSPDPGQDSKPPRPPRAYQHRAQCQRMVFRSSPTREAPPPRVRAPSLRSPRSARGLNVDLALQQIAFQPPPRARSGGDLRLVAVLLGEQPAAAASPAPEPSHSAAGACVGQRNVDRVELSKQTAPSSRTSMGTRERGVDICKKSSAPSESMSTTSTSALISRCRGRRAGASPCSS